MLGLNQIKTIAESPLEILSVYLNTQNRNASRHPRVPRELTWLRKEAAFLLRSLPPKDAERFQKEVVRVEQFFEGRHPEEKALAVFAGPKSWSVVPLQIGVKNEIRWGRPAIGQLFRILAGHYAYGVVVVDHRGARFFLFHLGKLTELGEKHYDIDESQWKRKDVGHVGSDRTRKAHGSDRDLFEHRMKAQYERLYRETVDQTTALSKKYDFAGIFLVGHERLVGPIERKFAASYETPLVTVTEDFGKFSPRGILRRLEPLFTEFEQKRQIAGVEQLLAAGGEAVTGMDETLARLQNGTIRNIVVAMDHDFHLRECAKCGTVNRFSDLICANCGGERRASALLDILPRLAIEHGTEVEFVTGEAAQILVRAGGIAGWLRQPKRTAAGRGR
jgi:hypothetical protein